MMRLVPLTLLRDSCRATEDDHVTDVLHSLAVKVDLVTVLAGQAFNLFENTAFGSVLLVEEGRYHSNSRCCVHQLTCLSKRDDTVP